MIAQEIRVEAEAGYLQFRIVTPSGNETTQRWKLKIERIKLTLTPGVSLNDILLSVSDGKALAIAVDLAAACGYELTKKPS